MALESGCDWGVPVLHEEEKYGVQQVPAAKDPAPITKGPMCRQKNLVKHGHIKIQIKLIIFLLPPV